jgi:hypothetical protein
MRNNIGNVRAADHTDERRSCESTQIETQFLIGVYPRESAAVGVNLRLNEPLL